MITHRSYNFKYFFVNSYCLVIICGAILFIAAYRQKNNNSLLDDQLNYSVDDGNRYFTTAFGNVEITDIEKYVFNEFGYSLITNELIAVLKKQISQTCKTVFLEWQKVADKGLTKNPPSKIPDSKQFLLNGYALVNYAYYNETPKNEVKDIKIWSKEYIDGLIKIAEQHPFEINPTYGSSSLAVHAATKHYNVKNKVGAVIGSQIPWAEVFILANGAKHVTTVDYQKIQIEHPKMTFLYTMDLVSQSEKYFNKFDFIVSFSSIEHSGLGRYGDPIDPIGDIREMNKIHCMLKTGGLLFVGFPVGIDAILYNAHRIYGRIRSAMMFEGFEMLTVFLNETIILNQNLRESLSSVNDNPGSGTHFLYVLRKIHT